MAWRTCWLIGSYAQMPEQEFEVNGNPVTVPAGNYYLYDADGALSLLEAFRLACLDGFANVVVGLRQTRLVKVGAFVDFAVTWGTATLLRDLLGFTTDLAGQQVYDAPNIAPLLWSPARTESSALSPLGIRGQRVAAVYQSQSPYDGTTENISHGAREYQRFFWRNVAYDRVWTADEKGGEWVRWWAQVAVPAARWKLYSPISGSLHGLAESTSDVAVDLSGVAPLGPYVVTAEKRGVNWDYTRSRGLEWTDRRADLEVQAHVCPEYTTE